MRWGLLLLCLNAAGCSIEDNLVACPGEILCPAGSVCDTVHGGCIAPEQAEVCVGLADQAACSAGSVSGYCLDEICIQPGCGNHVVEDDELCDDGNRRDGDGCSSTCLSREVCGDGALVRALGEECDDGNLQSHDGCDSRCITETEVWSVDELGPSRGDPSHMTFDPVRGQTVMVLDSYVWGWDGMRWSVLATGAPLFDDYDVVFDPSRSTLVVIAEQPHTSDFLLPFPPHDQLYEWDGTTWSHRITTNAPEVSNMTVAYDAARNRVFAFGVGENGVAVIKQLDVAAGMWTDVISPPGGVGTSTGHGLAYDAARSRIVLVIGGSFGDFDPRVHEWNGASWTSATTAMAASTGWTLVYDPSLSRVLAIGISGSGASTPVQSWNGTSWSNLPSLTGARYRPAVAYDAARGVRVVFGGSQGGWPDELAESTATGWLDVPRRAPAADITDNCAFDETRRQLVCVGVGNQTRETWTWDGTWTRRETLASAGDLEAITYDPVRRAVVALAGPMLMTFGDSGWQQQALQATVEDLPVSVVFDPRTQELVALTSNEYDGRAATVFVGQDGQVRSVSSTHYESLAYDARNGGVVAIGFLGSTVQLVGETWTPIVGPGGGYRAVTSARRGTVEFVAVSRPWIERTGSSWQPATSSPPHVIAGPAMIEQSTGTLHQIGLNGRSRFLLHRQWTSPTPFEQCPGSADLDGDGLAGCDDPDCWTACTPACPPLTTCP